MSRNDRKRQQLIEEVTAEGRKMGTRSVLLHAAVADKLGLSPSDHKCMDLIRDEPDPLTAGRLAELTGLSTGAITGVIDRLERAGFVARAEDPNDRRRVVIRRTPERGPDLRPIFAPLHAAMLQYCAQFSNEELEVVLSFMRGSGAVVKHQMQHLATLDPAPLPLRSAGAAQFVREVGEPAGRSLKRAARRRIP
jgi:DNA-binding MarR family transcriptional regulator